MPRSARPAALAGFAAALTAIVAARIRGGVQPYGHGGAAWIEHADRLHTVLLLRAPGQPSWGAWFAELDGMYPPGLHLVGALWGGLFGHAAERALWLGPLWWLLLAAAVARAARRVHVDGALAAGATLAIPALHGAATRYYYDLPMTALVWLAAGGGWAGGLAWGAACLVKWPAAVLAAQVVWTTSSRRDAVRSTVVAAALAGGWWAVSRGGSGADMAHEMWRGDAGVLGGLRGAPGRATFYGVGGALTVLSPPLSALWCAALALRRRSGDAGATTQDGRRLRALAAAIVGVHGALLLAVPVADERFLLPSAPLLALVFAAARPPRWLVALAAACALWVAGALHGVLPSSGVDTVRVAGREIERAWFGAAGSVEQRGWSRADRTADARATDREAVWAALGPCGRGRVFAAGPEGSIAGDVAWLDYRMQLAALDGGALGEPLEACDADADAVIWSGAPPPCAPADVRSAGGVQVGRRCR